MLAGQSILDYLGDLLSLDVFPYQYESYITVLNDMLLRRQLIAKLVEANKAYTLKRDAYLSTLKDINMEIDVEEILTFTSMVCEKKEGEN